MDSIVEFKGLNEHASIDDNELSDCHNISMEEYPSLSSRCGYEVFDNFDLGSPSQGIKAYGIQGETMITDKYDNFAMTHDVSAYLARVGQEPDKKTIYSGTSEEYDLYGCCNYNGVLTIFQGTRESMGMTVPKIVVYENWNSPQYIELTGLLGIGTIGVNNSFLLSFGSRLIIVKENEIHISFDNDISADKWQEYQINGVGTAECAQEIQITDDGYFTGCINYRDYPVFFKENSMYILYGEYNPFSLSRIDTVGCICPKTIAICNGSLYFLSKLGVMEYNGGTPKLISQNINLDTSAAAYGIYDSACADNRYYYIGDYIFDTYSRTWGKQMIPNPDTASGESVRIRPQCYFDSKVYVTGNLLVDVGGQSPYDMPTLYRSDQDALTEWTFTTKLFHEYLAGKKLLSKIIIGFEKAGTQSLKIEVSLDKKEFSAVYEWDGTTDFVKEVPVIFPPSDTFQIRVSGKGQTLIHYLKRIYRILGEW